MTTKKKTAAEIDKAESIETEPLIKPAPPRPTAATELVVDLLNVFARSGFEPPKQLALPSKLYLALCLESDADEPAAAWRVVEYGVVHHKVRAPNSLRFFGPRGSIMLTEEAP